MAVILISHNLGVVAGRADRVGVMYAGRFAELAPAKQLFADPRHHYTRALLAAIPMDAQLEERRGPEGDRAAEAPGGPGEKRFAAGKFHPKGQATSRPADRNPG